MLASTLSVSLLTRALHNECRYDYNSFAKGVTYDASFDGGSTDDCWHNLKAAWPKVIAAAQTDAGRALLTSKFRSCHPIRPPGKGDDDGQAIVNWATEPWAYMAMGKYVESCGS